MTTMRYEMGGSPLEARIGASLIAQRECEERDRRMTDWPLEAAALEWLRYERHCYLVCTERTPLAESCRPDILGMQPDRRLIEIEIKRNVRDFRANGDKRVMRLRVRWPAQFYFLVPPTIAETCRSELCSGLMPESYSRAGLLTLEDRVGSYSHLPQVTVVRRARVDPEARRLSRWEIGRMVRHQSGTLCRLAAENWRTRGSATSQISGVPEGTSTQRGGPMRHEIGGKAVKP
jgi:hypothetical protein